MALILKKTIPKIMHARINAVEGSGVYLVVGLGNPGAEYEYTRHNIGFMTLDSIASKNSGTWQLKKDLKCEVATVTIGDNKYILAKPTTFMNLSGQAVQAMQHFYKIDNLHTIIVQDELDINLGQIRLSLGGGSAGHNGIKSIIEHGVGESWRLRVGIGPKEPEQIDAADFVLQRFDAAQNTYLIDIINTAIELMTTSKLSAITTSVPLI
jgi:peptidyl-tRNA hydrolase, PTH1 family